jgi:hypothetical protein
MVFYNSNGELDGNPRVRTYGEEVAAALSALDCVLKGERALYASTELTTGRSLYQVLREHGFRTAAELRAKLGDEEYLRRVLNPHLAGALSFARSLQQRFPAERVVTPAPYSTRGWTQPEYLSLWETVIRTRIKSLYFHADWAISNGCAFEFAVAWDAGLATFNAEGSPLTLAAGRAQIEAAVRELEADSFDAAGLRESLERLGSTRST